MQPKSGGEIDAFLIKLRPAPAWNLLYSTYLGGSKLDGAYALSLDAAGNPIVSGVTASADFVSTSKAFQPHRHGTVDAFVTKVNREGNRILWSTYYGGSKENSDQYEGGGMAVDTTGRVWLAGMTNSTDLPTRHAYQGVFGGGDFDGFLAAFSADGSKLCYGSYIGGNAHDILEGLAISRSRVYASGLTASKNIQQKHWQARPGYAGGPFDAFMIALELPADLNCP